MIVQQLFKISHSGLNVFNCRGMIAWRLLHNCLVNFSNVSYFGSRKIKFTIGQWSRDRHTILRRLFCDFLEIFNLLAEIWKKYLLKVAQWSSDRPTTVARLLSDFFHSSWNVKTSRWTVEQWRSHEGMLGRAPHQPRPRLPMRFMQEFFRGGVDVWWNQDWLSHNLYNVVGLYFN